MTPRTFRFGQRGTAPEGEAPDQLVPVSYTHLTLPTNREV